MNKKKQNRMAVRQAAAKAVLRDEQNRRIQFAATNPEGEVLKNLRTTLRGLDDDAVTASRAKYGSNKVTHEKKKSLAQRLAGAFVNPFTAILFCLALVSTMTDILKVTNCYTRLRTELADPDKVQDDVLKNQTGASAVIHKGINVQVVYGLKVNAVRKAVDAELGLSGED